MAPHHNKTTTALVAARDARDYSSGPIQRIFVVSSAAIHIWSAEKLTLVSRFGSSHAFIHSTDRAARRSLLRDSPDVAR